MVITFLRMRLMTPPSPLVVRDVEGNRGGYVSLPLSPIRMVFLR
jgi:hypothetical protein